MSLIKITPIALRKIKDLLMSSQKKSLLFSIKGGGCNGFNYDFKPTNESLKNNDEQVIIDNIPIQICGSSLFHIIGTTIDYEESVMGTMFIFKNPNAKSQCGCGTSFGV